jgi:hypothetical protein
MLLKWELFSREVSSSEPTLIAATSGLGVAFVGIGQIEGCWILGTVSFFDNINLFRVFQRALELFLNCSLCPATF